MGLSTFPTPRISASIVNHEAAHHTQSHLLERTDTQIVLLTIRETGLFVFVKITEERGTSPSILS
jgi:hypothetical protein